VPFVRHGRKEGGRVGREEGDNELSLSLSHHLDLDIVDLPHGRSWAKAVLYLDRLWGNKVRVEQLLERTPEWDVTGKRIRTRYQRYTRLHTLCATWATWATCTSA